ncbi:outer membrane beta-barrel protein [Pedobacter sp. Du54]|uniref:outer membrane beta-barrel protein n=1 Tax=Pedobacter anseongensis TaxID=3133439 RepID=UPI00309C18DC
MILFIGLNTNSFGQSTSFKLKGKISNEDQQGLANASVYLVDVSFKPSVKTLSDSNGNFEITSSLSGDYILMVSYKGYEDYQSSIFKLADKNFKIQLVPISLKLNEVKIEGSKKTIEIEGNTLIYTVANSINAQGGNALDALKLAPGVMVDNNNAIALNGKQGVLILLDGKQTYLSSKEVADLLRSIPATSIKSFEIMNSPSAKYDATGTSGIINIKTTKSPLKGFNGSITTGLSYGVSIKQNEDLSFNYRKDKFNIYGGYNHFFGNYSYLYGSDRIQNAKSIGSFTDDTDKRKKIGSRLGFDYNLNAKHTIGLLANGNFIFGGGITRTSTDIDVPNSSMLNQTLDAVNDYYHQNTERYNFNLNYKFEDTLGHILNIDADYGYYEKASGNLQSNRYTNNQNVLLMQNNYRTLNGAAVNLKATKLDYTTNFWGGKLESGAKFSDISTNNHTKFLHLLTRKDSLDERRTNDFNFNENITSGYVNYRKSIGKWSFQGGLRLEHTESEGALTFRQQQQDAVENSLRKYTNLFPSFSVSVKPSANQNLSLSYSRRIDRPAYSDLNPFVYLLDELSFWQGNPFLKPQLSHRFALLYTYKSSTIIGLNFSHTNQYSTSITDTVGLESIVMIPKNLGTQQNISLTLTQLVSPAKWWEMTFNGTLYHIQNEIAFDQYRNLNLKQLAGRINLQQRFKLPYKINAEVVSSVNSKRLLGANEIMRPTSQVDLGVQRNFMNNKATLRLVFSDIYKGSKGNSLLNFEGFYLHNYNYYETRQIKLNFTYKFAQGSAKGPRTRNSALENENGRIK